MTVQKQTCTIVFRTLYLRWTFKWKLNLWMQANQRVLQQKLHKKPQVCEFAESTVSVFYEKYLAIGIYLVREFFCQRIVRKFWKVISVCGKVKCTVCSCLVSNLELFYTLFSLTLYFMLQKQYQLRFTEWLVVLINIKSYIKAINKMIREKVQSLQTCLLLHLKTRNSCQTKRFVAII